MSSEESSEEWTSAERIIVHHNPARNTWAPLLEEIKENGESAPVGRAALRASFTSIIHHQLSSQRKLRTGGEGPDLGPPALTPELSAGQCR